jgi:hypothetical protein
VLAERFFEQRPKRGGVDGRTREADQDGAKPKDDREKEPMTP